MDESVYNYMTTGKCDGSLIAISDIPDPTLKFIIEKVSTLYVLYGCLLKSCKYSVLDCGCREQ